MLLKRLLMLFFVSGCATVKPKYTGSVYILDPKLNGAWGANHLKQTSFKEFKDMDNFVCFDPDEMPLFIQSR